MAASDAEHGVPNAAVLDLLPEAVVVLDPRGTVMASNDRAQALLGLGDAVVGRPVGQLLELVDETGDPYPLPPPVPRIGDRMPERLLQLQGGEGWSRAIALSGRVRNGAWTLTARPAGRREALDRIQGDVVATVSHEIRSPLTSVKGFVRTLLLRWDRFSEDQKLAMLATVDADADRVTRLLQDLLEVSRIDAGRVTLRRSLVDLGALLRSVVERVSQRDDAGAREIRLTVVPDLPLLHADRDRLEQVLLNLVDNALRHAPEGAITLQAERVRAPEGDAGRDEVAITVADEGPGVAEELRPRIFRKFSRGRDSHHSGTGLGLYISRGLVQAHDGRIELMETGQGAAFRVRLPVPSRH